MLFPISFHQPTRPFATPRHCMLFPISLCPQPRLGLLQLSTCPPRPFATPGTVCTISEITLPVQQAFCSSLPAHKAFCYSQDPLYCFQIHFPPPRQSSALHPPNRLFVNLGTIYMLIHFNYNSLHLLTLNSLLPPTLATTSLSFMWRLNS